MVIYKYLILASVICTFTLFMGCSKNGIEGNVQYYGSNKPASGIKIEAKTYTDIKEEQAQAVLSATSDSNGHFNIKSLLPNRNYTIKSVDPNFDGTIAEVVAPEKGTKIIKEPIIVCPVPSSDGIWVYDEGTKKLKQIEDKRVQFRFHRYTGWLYHCNAYSISDEDSQKATILPRNGLLIIRGNVSNIGQLFRIPRSTVLLGANRSETVVIEEGWYYNTSDFYVTSDGFSRYMLNRKFSPSSVNLIDTFKSERVIAIPLNRFEMGLYILITKAEEGMFLDNPREGVLITFNN